MFHLPIVQFSLTQVLTISSAFSLFITAISFPFVCTGQPLFVSLSVPSRLSNPPQHLSYWTRVPNCHKIEDLTSAVALIIPAMKVILLDFDVYVCHGFFLSASLNNSCVGHC